MQHAATRPAPPSACAVIHRNSSACCSVVLPALTTARTELTSAWSFDAQFGRLYRCLGSVPFTAISALSKCMIAVRCDFWEWQWFCDTDTFNQLFLYGSSRSAKFEFTFTEGRSVVLEWWFNGCYRWRKTSCCSSKRSVPNGGLSVPNGGRYGDPHTSSHGPSLHHVHWSSSVDQACRRTFHSPWRQ